MLDIRISDWVLKDRQTNNMFIMDAYNGVIQVKVRPAEKGAQVIIRRPITMEKTHIITKVIQKIMAASPETKIAIKFDTFDRQSKQRRLDWVLTFEKDAKMCYRIHITDAAGGKTFVFGVRGPMDVSIGSDPMSDSDRSAIKMHDLISWIECARMWAPAYTQPYNAQNAQKKPWAGKSNNGGNGGGWNKGGYNNNSNAGGNGGGGYGGGGSNGGGGSLAPDPDESGLPF